MESFIHHIEWCVKDINRTTNCLTTQYGFTLISERKSFTTNNGKKSGSSFVYQKVVQSGSTIFLLTQNNSEDNFESNVRLETGYPILSCCSSKRNHRRDTVFNVCLEVKNVDASTEKAIEVNNNCGKENVVLIPPTTIVYENKFRLRYSVIKSICGNIIHTLLDSKDYRKHINLPFLPGFVDVRNKNINLEHFSTNCNETSSLTSFIDHVTYVCQAGESKSILDWYKKCFGMERFLVGSKETLDDDGIEIGHDVEMRITVGEWISSWMCREEGVKFNSSQCCNEGMNFKLVLAEPLGTHKFSHVQQFIDEHEGPGIQHIGLRVRNNISSVVEKMIHCGAKFRKPPPAYYTLTDKRTEIIGAKECLSQFKALGLLLDTEVDFDDGHEQIVITEFKKVLIQIFTKPIFDENTFFLEILERRGAKGFGAGNITALAKSIILQQTEEKLSI